MHAPLGYAAAILIGSAASKGGTHLVEHLLLAEREEGVIQ